jgi:hypothetical protein
MVPCLFCNQEWACLTTRILGSCITYWALKSSLDAIHKEIKVKPDIVMFPTTELEIVNINGQLPICLIVWGNSVGRFSLFMRTAGSGFEGRFWEPPWFFKKKSHFENCPGFQNLKKKNQVRQFSGSVVLTKFWAVGFQGRFSEVGSHKSWFAKNKTMICKSRFTGEKVHWASTGHGMKLSLAANLVLNWVCPVLSFSRTLSINHCCCYVYCSYKCSRALCI